MKSNNENQKELAEALKEGQNRVCLLVVEDDPEIRGSLQMLLGGKYEVIAMPSGNRILEMIDGYDPDLVILDVNLPGKDGFKLCQMIRSRPGRGDLPIMFLTVLRDDETFMKTLQVNADAYLNKPFDAGELRETIDRLVGPGQI